MANSKKKKVALIASKGTLDWAYPPFILASTAAAMDMEVKIFFTFYGLTLLNKKIVAKISSTSNPAMPFKLPFGPKEIAKINWSVPNILSGNIPGFDTMASSMMKKTFKKNGVSTIEELRAACIDNGVKFIACTMTMDVFGFKRDNFIDEIEEGGAATFLDFAADADFQLFI